MDPLLARQLQQQANAAMQRTMDNMAVALLLRDVSENAAKYLSKDDTKAP